MSLEILCREASQTATGRGITFRIQYHADRFIVSCHFHIYRSVSKPGIFRTKPSLATHGSPSSARRPILSSRRTMTSWSICPCSGISCDSVFLFGCANVDVRCLLNLHNCLQLPPPVIQNQKWTRMVFYLPVMSGIGRPCSQEKTYDRGSIATQDIFASFSYSNSLNNQ